MLLKSHLTEGILWFKQMSCLLTGRNQWGLPPLSLFSLLFLPAQLDLFFPLESQMRSFVQFSEELSFFLSFSLPFPSTVYDSSLRLKGLESRE